MAPTYINYPWVSEKLLAEPMRAYLEARGMTTYAEVTTSGNPSRRFDIVATQNDVVMIVECKLFGSDNLVRQAIMATCFSHRTAIAIPSVSILRPRHYKTLAAEGIGIYRIAERGCWQDAVECEQDADFRRVVDNDISDRLIEAQRSNEAGSKMAQATPITVMLKEAVEYVIGHPGCMIRDVAENVKSPYGMPATMAILRDRLPKTNQVWLRISKQGRGYVCTPRKTK